MPLTLTIRVTPAASRTQVGGALGEALRVRVTAPAVDGRATDAALRAIADAFDVRPHAVTLVHGHASRTKTITIEGETGPLAERLRALLVE
jgi:uncharacterized protein (TIGR00251 family)